MNPRIQKIFIALSDLLAQIAAFLIGAAALLIWGQYSSLEALEYWWTTTGEIHTLVHFVFVALVLLRFYVKGLYTQRLPFWDELRLLMETLFYLALLSGITVIVARWPFSKVLWCVSWAAATALVPSFRSITRYILIRLNCWQRPTVVIGVGETAVSTYRALQSEPQLSHEILKFIAFDGHTPSKHLPPEIPVEVVSPKELIQHLQEMEIKYLQVLIALDQVDTHMAEELLEKLSLHFEYLQMVPPIGGLPLFGLEVNHFFSHEVLLLRSKNNLGFRPKVWAKRAFDLVAASILLVVLSPLMLFIAWQLRRQGGPGGVFFVQPRWGYKGRTFNCYKFRTMIPNAEQVLQELLERDPVARKEWEEKTKITNDPRVTPIGEFLRKTSLDELPQLFNVIKGDMSLVGPRPILLHEADKYGARMSFYKHVRPGITGLWQVSGRSDTDYANRVRLDTWYVKNWSPWYDIAIMFKTLQVVWNRKGAY